MSRSQKKTSPLAARRATVPKFRYVLGRMWVEVSSGHHHAVIGAKLKELLTLPAWDAAPEFFSYTLVAHFDAAVLGLTRLFDAKSDVLSIEALIRGAEREAGNFAQLSAAEVRATLIPRIRKEVATQRPLIAPFTKRRNELLAHSAAEHTLTDAEWNIPWSDLKRHYEQVMQLVNAVAQSFEGDKAMLVRGARESTVEVEIKRVLAGFRKRQVRAQQGRAVSRKVKPF